MAWTAWLRGAAGAVALLALLWAAASAQERPALTLVEAGGERLVVGWGWDGGEVAAFSVHWRLRVSGETWEAAETAGSARQFAITGLRPESAYIVRVRALDARGKGIRVTGGRLYDLRAVFDTTRLPAPAAPRIAFDGERATAAWDAVDGATGYELAWGAADGDAAAERLDADALEFETGALTAGTRYEFRLRSLHGRRWSALSDAATLTPAAWPHAAPRARFEFHRAGGILVEWDAVDGADRYAIRWSREHDPWRDGATEATGTSLLVTREGAFITGTWLLRIRAIGAGMWSETTRLWINSPAPELRFWLESSRELCTEGTLTEIRWRGGGGAGNLWPHISGEAIGENTYRVKVNCGLIPRDANGKIDETQRDAVITGFLRDGRGAVKHASIRVPRAEALPAPEDIGLKPYPDELTLGWQPVDGPANTAEPPVSPLYLVRWRQSGSSAWAYQLRPASRASRVFWTIRELTNGTSYELGVAAIREQIEMQTPDALRWSAIIPASTPVAPTNVRVTTTHDEITVFWDRQPSVHNYTVSIVGPDAPTGQVNDFAFQYVPAGERNGVGSPHSVTFRHLIPGTIYGVEVQMDDVHEYQVPLTTSTEARTKAAPADWTPLLRGPQNLQTTITATSLTVIWAPPYAGASPEYVLTLIDPNRGLSRTDWIENTTFTYHHLEPGVMYHLEIEHLGVVPKSISTTIQTLRTGTADNDDTQLQSDSEFLTPQWVPGLPAFAWPIEFSDDWRMTTDMWVPRGVRYHAGLDAAGDRNRIDYILASAAGKLRIYDLRTGGFLVYCPDPTKEFQDLIMWSSQEWIDGNRDGIYECGALASSASGIVAVILHEEINGRRYLSKYGHLAENTAQARNGASDARKKQLLDLADTNKVFDVAQGQLIGIEGTTTGTLGGSTGDHLHFEIRVFDANATTMLKNWHYRDLGYTRGCAKVTSEGTESAYCAWGDFSSQTESVLPADLRRTRTALDPERVLPPPPASMTATRAADRTGEKTMDNTIQRFSISRASVATGAYQGQLEIGMEVGFWRPVFYTYSNLADSDWQYPAASNGKVRIELEGISGTNPGVTEYGAIVGCDRAASARTSALNGHGDRGEVPPVSVKFRLPRGRSCEIVAKTGNRVYPANVEPIAGLYGRNEFFVPIVPVHPKSTVRHVGSLSNANRSQRATLSREEFHFYEISTQAGYRYSFSTKKGSTAATDDLVLKLWNNGQIVSDSDRTDMSKIEGWMASATGTVFLSVEGAVKSDHRRWSGAYEISYSHVAPLLVNATANPLTCLPDGKTTVSWTVTGGTGSVTVTVSGEGFDLKTFRTRSGSKEIPCRRLEGRQTVTISVVDSAGERPDRPTVVGIAVHRPICVAQGGVSGQAATDGGGVDSATCKPPAPVLSSSWTATSSSITASWSAATGATVHKAQIGKVAAGGSTTYGSEQPASGSAASPYTFSSLDANQQYSIRITAYNGTIKGGQHERTGFWTKPAAPANLSVTQKQPTSLTITWTAISGLTYKVQRTGQSTWSTPSGTGTHTFTSLTAGTTYTVKVRAENTAGASPTTSTTATTPTVLSATLSPTTARCQTGNSISITWTATGGTSPYTTTPAKPHTYNCTRTGTKTVTFTIKDSGTPKQSITKQARVVVTSPPPPPPHIPDPDPIELTAEADKSACPTNGKVKVTWSTEHGTGTIRVTVDGTSVTTSPTEVTCQGTVGMQNIVVRATDSIGSDSETIRLTVVAPLVVTPSSSAIRCTTGTEVTISWTVSGGTRPYTQTVDGASVSSSSKKVQCPATVNGTKTIEIVATDSTDSPQLRDSESVVLTGACNISAPSGLSTSVAHHDKITLSWTAVSGKSYRVRKSSTDATGVSASGSSHQFTGLSSDTSYNLSVQAVEGTCKSSWAASESARTYAKVRIVIRYREDGRFEVGMRIGDSTTPVLPRLRFFTAQTLNGHPSRAARSSEIIENRRDYGKVRVSFSSMHPGDIIVQAVTPASEIKTPNRRRFDVSEMSDSNEWKTSSFLYYASASTGSAVTGTQGADALMDAAPAGQVDMPSADGGLLEADDEPSE